MYEIVDDDPDRLTIRIGSKGRWNRALFRLDRATGQMTLERGCLNFSRKTLTVPFADILRIDALTLSNQLSILVGLRSRKRYWCAADRSANTNDAVQRLRAFLSLEAATGSPLSPGFRWFFRILAFAVVAVGILSVVGRISNAYFLPSCASNRTTETLHKLIASTNNNGRLADFETLEQTRDQEKCRATYASVDKPSLRVTYRVYWQDSNVMVQYLSREVLAGDAAHRAPGPAETPAAK